MKIIYLHQYFVAPKSSGRQVTGTRSYEFARRFAAAGHQVHMVCSDWVEQTKGLVAPPGGWRQDELDGIHIHALPLRYSNKMGFRQRLAVFARFAWKARRKAAQLGGDVVFATSTPLTIAIPGIHASKVNKIPMVFEVRDLWPEAPRQMGVLTNPILLGLARRLEKAAYRHAKAIVALSPGMREGVIAAGVSPERVTMIPNSCDLDLFHPQVDGSAARARLGVGQRLAFLYFGTMGPANGLEFVLDAAGELQRRGERDAVFVLHGDGKDRPALVRRKEQEHLENVIFSDPLGDKSKVAEIVAAADVCMTIYKNLPVLYTCSPNKMFDSLAAGRPVLTNMPGWLGDLVEQNACGVLVRPDSAQDFADKVQSLLARRSTLGEMGRHARALAVREFARDDLAAKVQHVLEAVVANSNSGETPWGAAQRPAATSSALGRNVPV